MPGQRAHPTVPVATADVGTSFVDCDAIEESERTLAWRLVIVAVLAYVVAQLILIPISRPPGFDESIYLSQVTPDAEPGVFLAWRARGITLLVAPITWLSGSVTAVRVFLLVASAVAIAVAFRIWIPLIGLAAPVGAATFCFSWLALLNGTEVMPNLWAAILGLATTGLVARRIEGGADRHAVLAAVTLGAMALVRPTEAAVLAAAIGLWIVVFRRSWWRLLVGLGIGLALGWLPWFVEMSIRFGGPARALEAAAFQHVGTASVAHNVVVHLAATDGQRTVARVTWAGVLWWTLLVALTVVAIARARKRSERTASILASLGAVALAVEYLVFVPALAARFLLPSYALASIPAGIGLMTLVRPGVPPRTIGRVVGVVLLALLLPWAIWQGAVANRFQTRRMNSTLAYESIGLELRRLAGGEPCAVVAPHGWPTMALVSGCGGTELPRPAGPTAAELDELRRDGRQVFVILKRPASRSSPLESLTPLRVEGPNVTWFVYQVPSAT